MTNSGAAYPHLRRTLGADGLRELKELLRREIPRDPELVRAIEVAIAQGIQKRRRRED